MSNRYRNPWANETNVKGPAFYENDGVCVATHREVQVIKLFAGRFDFVFAECCIAQRGACDALSVIDEILDGFAPVSNAVAEHINANGGKAMSWGYYAAHWQEIDAQQANV